MGDIRCTKAILRCQEGCDGKHFHCANCLRCNEPIPFHDFPMNQQVRAMDNYAALVLVGVPMGEVP